MATRVRAWSALGGLAFSVLAVVGAVLLFDGPSDSSPAKMTAWYQSSSHRTHIHIGWLLTGFGLFFLIWFVAALRERVAATGTDDSSFLASIVGLGGGVFVAVALVVIATADGLKTMSDDTYQHLVYSGVIHGAGDAAYMMLVTGGAAMASMIFATSAAVLGAGILPRWVGWFGIVAGAAAILSLFFFTMLIWLLWVAVTSVVLFQRARSAPAVARPEPIAASVD